MLIDFRDENLAGNTQLRVPFFSEFFLRFSCIITKKVVSLQQKTIRNTVSYWKIKISPLWATTKSILTLYQVYTKSIPTLWQPWGNYDATLIQLWCTFDMPLICLWYDFDMTLSHISDPERSHIGLIRILNYNYLLHHPSYIFHHTSSIIHGNN